MPTTAKIHLDESPEVEKARLKQASAVFLLRMSKEQRFKLVARVKGSTMQRMDAIRDRDGVTFGAVIDKAVEELARE